MTFLEKYKFYTPAPPDMSRIAELAELLFSECAKFSMGNPLVPGRLQEIIMAHKLGHRISETVYGADAYDERGVCEYKSTIDRNISGTYSSISKQLTWEDQEAYHQKKFGDMNHYIGRFDDGLLVEVWKLDGNKVIDIITPSLYKQYTSTKHRKDPRLGTSLCKRDIYKYGERVL